MSTQETIRALVLRVMQEHRCPVPREGAPLEVDSLAVVALVDALEVDLGIRLRPADVRAETFDSMDALIHVVMARMA